MPDAPRDRGDRRARPGRARARPRVSTTAVRPIRPGVAVSGAVERDSRDRDGGAGLGVASGSGAQSESRTRRTATSLCGSNATTCRRGSARRTQLDDGVLLARDDVRGRHDEIGPRDPAASLHADAARRSEHAHHTAAPRGATPRRARAGVGRQRRARPGRRSTGTGRCARAGRARRAAGRSVEPLDDRRALSTAAKLRLPGHEQRDRARHPDDREPADAPRARGRRRSRAAAAASAAARRGAPSRQRARASGAGPLRPRRRPAPRAASTASPSRREAGAARAREPSYAPTTIPASETR